MDKLNAPKIGQIVKIIRGNENEMYAVVIKIMDSRFVLIADGLKRKFDHPKKKNILHLQLQNSISHVVFESIEQTGRVTNGKLRFALKSFMEKLKAEERGKGE